jgi:hypothetical protein
MDIDYDTLFYSVDNFCLRHEAVRREPIISLIDSRAMNKELA